MDPENFEKKHRAKFIKLNASIGKALPENHLYCIDELREIDNLYEPENICNLDKSALFYHMSHRERF